MSHHKATELVSIVLPVYNAQRTIEDCVASLERQDYPTTELIVVNDGSTDETSVILERLSNRYKMTILNTPRRGRSEAKNLGMTHAQGRVLAFAEADAKCGEHWISDAIEHLESDVGGVVGPRYCWSTDTSVSKAIDLKLRLRYHDPSFEPTTGWVFAKRVLLDIQGFDPRLVVAEDRDVGIRILRKGYRLAFAPHSIIYHTEPRSMTELVGKEFDHAKARTEFYRKYPRDYPLLRVLLFWSTAVLFVYGAFLNWLGVLLLSTSVAGITVIGQIARLRVRARRARISFARRYFLVASFLDVVRNLTSTVGATIAGLALVFRRNSQHGSVVSS